MDISLNISNAVNVKNLVTIFRYYEHTDLYRSYRFIYLN